MVSWPPPLALPRPPPGGWPRLTVPPCPDIIVGFEKLSENNTLHEKMKTAKVIHEITK